MTETRRRRRGDIAANPGMWADLQSGRGLRQALQLFYAAVYEDPRLSPFFEGVTRDRAIEKQYNFMTQVFTGEKVYFGDRPRNAHHWMVISDELFDYREELLARSLRQVGLSEQRILEWRAVDETFRKQIVKSEPRPKMIRGIAMPLEGYDDLVLAVATLCDGCQGPLEVGATAWYHVRTGRTYCAGCRPDARASQRPGGA